MERPDRVCQAIPPSRIAIAAPRATTGLFVSTCHATLIRAWLRHVPEVHRSERDLRSVAEGNRSGQRARTPPHRVAVIAALYDPLAVFLTYDLSNVMAPHHDRADMRAACVRSVIRPRTREIVRRPG